MAAPPAAEWPDATEPLDSAALPSFPTDTLPSWLRTWVGAQTEALQVPAELPGLLALSVVATASAKKAAVVVREGWIEPLNIFALVTLPSGSRKSVLFEAATKPIVEAENGALRATTTAEATEATASTRASKKGARLRVISGGSVEEIAEEATLEASSAQQPFRVSTSWIIPIT